MCIACRNQGMCFTMMYIGKILADIHNGQLNPLIKDKTSFDNEYPDKVSVYHYSSKKFLGQIIQSGHLLVSSNFSHYNNTLEEIFERDGKKYNNPLYSRKNAVFAYAELDNNMYDNGGGMGKGEGNDATILEIKVDPKQALVVNAEMVTEASNHLKEKQDTWGYEEGYWEQAMLLSDFLHLSKEDRKNKFTFPEVLISGNVELKYIRLIQGTPHIKKIASE